jgi:hypothetical protein
LYEKGKLYTVFFDVIDVEEDVGDFVIWEVLWYVFFEEFLEFDGEFGDLEVAHFVVPSDDLATLDFWSLFDDPGGDGLVIGAGGYEVAEGFEFDFGEIEPELVEGAAGVVFACCFVEDCAAFIEGAGGDDIACDGGVARAAREVVGKIGGWNGHGLWFL